MKKLNKLKAGDKVAIVSPSFAGPGKWPIVYELGLKRLREIFELEPVEYTTTKQIGASTADRTRDLIAAFTDPQIKAVFATIGGDDQITFIKNLPVEPFLDNPKPFFGYSDNSHFTNFLFLNNIPSFYGGSVLTQFAMQGSMDEYTIEYLKKALFKEGEFELTPSSYYNDQGLNWDNPALLTETRVRFDNPGFIWNNNYSGKGLLWGGCVESVDEMLRHGVAIPTLEQFKDIVLMLETSEEIPTADYVNRVFRALGERGILGNVKGVLIGRAKAWEYDKQNSNEEKELYRIQQAETIQKIVTSYNSSIPLVQNLNFGHTDPQIPMPYSNLVTIDGVNKLIKAHF